MLCVARFCACGTLVFRGLVKRLQSYSSFLLLFYYVTLESLFALFCMFLCVHIDTTLVIFLSYLVFIATIFNFLVSADRRMFSPKIALSLDFIGLVSVSMHLLNYLHLWVICTYN